jgi:putative FmdB family regulatory protein
MPFYEYQCSNCGHHEEVLQKITDKPLKKCPNCGKNGLKKLMSAPVFRLKGTGWYETDFKTDKENKRNLVGADKEESKSETKPDAKSDLKTDTKSDAKTETAKAESSKPEKSEKAGKPASKSPARSKSKAKPARPAKRSRR